MVIKLRWWLLAWLAMAPVLVAQQPLMEKIDAKEVKQWFAESFAENQQRYADNPEVRVWRGIVANRKTREVRVQAIATGLETEPIEFFLVTEFGRDYESVAVTLAKPSHIHAALEFIGLTPGYTINYSELVFWPKGPRVMIAYEWQDEQEDGTTTTERMPVEKSVVDGRTQAPLPVQGFMFTGSVTVDEEADEGEPTKRYAADLGGEIISDFNERWTVLDVPYRAEQGVVYGSIHPNKETVLPAGTHLQVVMTPAAKPGETLLRDYRVEVRAADPETPPAGPAELRLHVARPDGSVVHEAATFDAFLAFLGKEREAGHDVYLQVGYERSLPVTALVELAGMIETLGEHDVLRLEPLAEEIYHQALLPEPRFYQRQERLLQPLEVYLKTEQRTLLVTHESYDERGSQYRLEQLPFTDPASLKELLASREEWPSRTLFFMITADTTYGEVLDYYLPLREQYPILYILFHKPGIEIPKTFQPPANP